MSVATTETARAIAESVARASYGKLIAMISARTRDVASAEDALAEAFRIALQSWPQSGIPLRPEAWLLTVARREAGHAARHARVRAAASPTLEIIASFASDTIEAIPDERLKLMFVCAHPAIDPSLQAPLMLQTVLGLDAERIAACFLSSPSAMAQRLVRGKSKIKDAGLAFEVPGADELPGRLDAVLAAIYAAYGTGWEDVMGADPKRKGLTEEAIWLARMVVGLVPDAEAQGLLALMLYCEARRPARRSASGQFVRLSEQDCGLWSGNQIAEAEHLLLQAARATQPGRFQTEAAIQSVHVNRAVTGETHWSALIALYGLLVHLSPTIGVRVAEAAALVECGSADVALSRLDALGDAAGSYQPYWVARGEALAKLSQSGLAREAFIRGAGMSEDETVRNFLLARADAFGQPSSPRKNKSPAGR